MSEKDESHYVYMYKRFTSKAYRVQRLHGMGMMPALNENRDQGFKGMVAYVDSNNFDSLKSCYRIGFNPCGCIRVIRLAGRCFVHAGRVCSRLRA